MNAKKRLLYILMGPISLLITTLLLTDLLTKPGAQAIGVLVWCIIWWATRPVHIAVTGILPVVLNSLLNIVPMAGITSQYTSDSIILIFGSSLMVLPWAIIGLDKRIALKILSVIGPSMKSQITVWLLTSIFLSSVLPNVLVCALLTPIAVSMLKAAGYDDISKSPPAVPILLSIGWGVGLGGVGTPLGGAMNLVAISYFEEFTGKEFMYIDWIVRVAPYFIIATIVMLIFMLLMPLEVKFLEGTKEFFTKSYKELGPMKKDEKICSVLFVLGSVAAFTRPLYADLFPGLAPAYSFLILGFLCFFITSVKKEPLLTWDEAQSGMMWGMMILFGGGLAIGKLVNGSGASENIANVISTMNLDGGLLTIIVFTILARIIGEFTNGTTAAAVVLPIMFSFTAQLGLNPVPYWFIMIFAYNAEFILPISVRAIPVAYGLPPQSMLKYGTLLTILNSTVVVIVGYTLMQIWPAFSQLSFM